MRVFLEQTQGGRCRRAEVELDALPDRGDVIDMTVVDADALDCRFRGEVSFRRWTNYTTYVVLFTQPRAEPPKPACVGG